MVKLIHKNNDPHNSVINKSFPLAVAEKALKDSERKPNLHWELADDNYQYKKGALTLKKKKTTNT